MKRRFILYRRKLGGMFYIEDSATRKQESTGTKNRAEATSLLNARNESVRQPQLNLQIAKAYLAGTDSGVATRTWQQALDSIVETKSGSTQDRWRRAAKETALDSIRHRIILETQAEHLFACLKAGTVSTNVHLRKLHNFCLSMNWLPWPLIPKRLWPEVRFKDRRAITSEEHRLILEREKNPERRRFYELCWHLGGSQTDIANLKAEDIDWPNQTIAYARQKTGSLAMIHFGPDIEAILRQMPTTGPLFPYLQSVRCGDRATEFKQRVVERLINPFCGAEKWRLYTAKYHKESKDIGMLADRVRCLYEMFSDGFTDLDNLADIEIAATHDLPVMIVGESGSGKEGIAKHIHHRWAQEQIRDEERQQGVLNQFTAINCAALSETLLESELFGHERGSFTGADRRRIGKFEECNGGTIFLDEIGDMSLNTQTKILRVLQDGTFQRVGGNQTLETNVRLITATSDPRFAAFAGYTDEKDSHAPPLKGQWRSKDEMTRPLRSDLLSRVKVQTIRVVPVNEDNVERIVKQMIAARCTGKVEEQWEVGHDGAIEALVAKFKAQIKGVNAAQAKWEMGEPSNRLLLSLPFFGHRREIGQVIDLINAYVQKARRRGARRSDQRVTKRDVEFIYRPSSVLMAVTNSNAGGQNKSAPEEPWPIAKIVEKEYLETNTAQYWVAHLLREHFGKPLDQAVVLKFVNGKDLQRKFKGKTVPVQLTAKTLSAYKNSVKRKFDDHPEIGIVIDSSSFMAFARNP